MDGGAARRGGEAGGQAGLGHLAAGEESTRVGDAGGGGLGEASLQARWVQARLRHLTREACPPGLLARPRRPCHGECPRGWHRAMAGLLRGARQN